MENPARKQSLVIPAAGFGGTRGAGACPVGGDVTRESNGAEEARERLGRALDMLEARIGRQLTTVQSVEGLHQEVEALTADRSRLAQELDKARAHAARLDAAAGHAEERVSAAIETIEGLLGDR